MDSKEPLLPVHTKEALKKRVLNLLDILILFLTTLLLSVYFFPTELKQIDASTDNVIAHLQALEDIADAHGGTRSVAKGSPTADYLVEQLQSLNDTFKIWKQPVPLLAQIDSEPPHVALIAKEHWIMEPRRQVSVFQASGSSTAEDAQLVLVNECESSVSLTEDWIAVINYSDRTKCSPCERLKSAVENGAKAVLFYLSPGSERGYPHSLPPFAGRCPIEYKEWLSQTAVLSLSDDATFKMLEWIAIYPDLRVDLAVHSEHKQIESYNVIAETRFGGEDIVIFGAHLDSVPSGPGVNDDGSGTAATLELAHALHRSGLKTRQTVRFAWWTGEEIGLLGSRHYVNDLGKDDPYLLQRHKVNIDTDMIASPNYVRGVWDGTSIKEDKLRTKVEKVSQVFKNYFDKRQLPTTKFEFNGRSDFAPFLDAGIPAGGVITGEDEIKTIEGAKLFGGISGMVLDPCYHQDCDRLVNLQGPGFTILEQNVDALAHALEFFSQTDLDQFFAL
ncbi:hypothetical protein EDD86DRAFT_192267 [Gorgonomyces haynaldii]|nr:hypothetical protein EDD86DRAFT_192267 [Gorgonomyces haynaldii]